MRSATASRRRNFSADTSARAVPSWASGAQAASKGAPAAGHGPHGAGRPQRGQRGAASQGSARRQERQSGSPDTASARPHARHAGGIGALFVALISPVDRLAEQLFVMHMVQHLLIVDVAAILLTLGLTKVILRPVTRRVQRIEERAGVLAHPGTALVFYVAGMW